MELSGSLLLTACIYEDFVLKGIKTKVLNMQKREQKIPLQMENTLVSSEGQILGTDKLYKAQ